MGEIIFVEILQRFRNSSNFKQTISIFSTLEQLPMPGVDMFTVCANNYRSLIKRNYFQGLKKCKTSISGNLCGGQLVLELNASASQTGRCINCPSGLNY